jgi:hypothetical protein
MKIVIFVDESTFAEAKITTLPAAMRYADSIES